jgi:XTP/dITP diphosphohydrolase
VRLTFITGNPGKLQEAREALGPHTRLEQDPHGYPEIQADTLEEVARAGLEAVAERLQPPYFLEDAGLFIDALGGFPGVYSAYVFKTLGNPGILRLLQDTPDPERSARFQAVIGYRDPDGNDHLLTGTCEGWIRREATGDHGFGFDPIFTPKALSDSPAGASFAELGPAKKNRLSHRGAALQQLSQRLKETTQATPAAHEKDS